MQLSSLQSHTMVHVLQVLFVLHMYSLEYLRVQEVHDGLEE